MKFENSLFTLRIPITVFSFFGIAFGLPHLGYQPTIISVSKLGKSKLSLPPVLTERAFQTTIVIYESATFGPVFFLTKAFPTTSRRGKLNKIIIFLCAPAKGQIRGRNDDTVLGLFVRGFSC